MAGGRRSGIARVPDETLLHQFSQAFLVTAECDCLRDKRFHGCRAVDDDENGAQAGWQLIEARVNLIDAFGGFDQNSFVVHQSDATASQGCGTIKLFKSR